MSFLSRFRKLHPSAPGDDSPASIARKLAAGGSHNIPGKDKPALVKLGVPTIKDKLNAVFMKKVQHPDARGIGAPDGGSYDTSGSGGQLRGNRPSLPYGCVWRGVCNKPADFEEGGLHNLFGKPDNEGYLRGYILIRVNCHGEQADITVSFQQCRHNAGGVILAFPFPKVAKLAFPVILTRFPARLALPAPPVRLLLMDAGQNYWTAPVVHCYRIQHDFAPYDPNKVVAVAYVKTPPDDESDFDRRTREIMERFNQRTGK